MRVDTIPDNMPRFGQRVGVVGILKRAWERRKHPALPALSVEWKFWKSKPIPMKEGIVIGWRILCDGHVDWEPEDGKSFTPVDHYRVALVIFNERQNPVYVLPGDLRKWSCD
jgi:hypothetical protein